MGGRRVGKRVKRGKRSHSCSSFRELSYKSRFAYSDRVRMVYSQDTREEVSWLYQTSERREEEERGEKTEKEDAETSSFAPPASRRHWERLKDSYAARREKKERKRGAKLKELQVGRGKGERGKEGGLLSSSFDWLATASRRVPQSLEPLPTLHHRRPSSHCLPLPPHLASSLNRLPTRPPLPSTPFPAPVHDPLSFTRSPRSRQAPSPRWLPLPPLAPPPDSPSRTLPRTLPTSRPRRSR